MSSELSPGTEAFIAGALAGGTFPTREALLESAVEALRRQWSPDAVGQIPTEHLALVEQALADLDAGRGEPWSLDEELSSLSERIAERNRRRN